MIWSEYLDSREQSGIWLFSFKSDPRMIAAGHSYAEAFGRLWLMYEDAMIALVRAHAISLPTV